MGGLVVLSYALDGRRAAGLAGVIASGTAMDYMIGADRRRGSLAPALEPGTPIPWIKLAAGRLASKVCPRLTVDNGLDPGNVSRIKAEVQRFTEDPLCHARISLQTGFPVRRRRLVPLNWVWCSWLPPGRGRSPPEGCLRGAIDTGRSAAADAWDGRRHDQSRGQSPVRRGPRVSRQDIPVLSGRLP